MKRFTDSDKWRDPWYRQLRPIHKNAFQWLVDNCDNAGVVDVDRALAEFQIGAPVDWEGLASAMGDRVIILPSGKWYLTRFIAFQYGDLNEECRPHQQVIRLLKSHGVTENKGYPKGIHTPQDRTGQDKDSTEQGQVDVPLGFTDAFATAWAEYVDYRRKSKLRPLQPATIKARFEEFFAWGEPASIEAIRNTISNGWQGIFHPSKGKDGKANAPHQPNSRSFAQRQSYADLGI